MAKKQAPEKEVTRTAASTASILGKPWEAPVVIPRITDLEKHQADARRLAQPSPTPRNSGSVLQT